MGDLRDTLIETLKEDEHRWRIQYHPELKRWRVVDVVFPLSRKYRTKAGAERRIAREARKWQRRQLRERRKEQMRDGWEDR